MSSPVSVLLFDLGGVLIDFSGLSELQTLLPERTDDTALLGRWTTCPHSLAYGTGQLSTSEFMAHFRQDWGIALEPAAFLEAWQGWVRGWLPGAADLLAELRPRYRLAALSNSNAAHWERLEALGVLGEFDLAIGSQQTGFRKPDPAIYRDALARLDVAATSVLFFDDSGANVEAARTVGMAAAQVAGPAAVRRHLVDHGLL